MRLTTKILTAAVCLVLLTAGLRGQSVATAAPTQKQKVLWSKLGSGIEAVDRQLDGVLGVAIEDLTTGQKFLLREDEVVPQASSIKIAIPAELYHQAQLPAANVVITQIT